MSNHLLVYISGIAIELGRFCPADDILKDGDTPKDVKLLIEKGVKSYSKLEVPLSKIVIKCIKETLALACLKPSEVNGVFLITESFSELLETPIARGDTPMWTARNALFEVFSNIGIESSPVFCSTYGGSSNFLQGLYLAYPLAETGRAKHILLICIDCMPPNVSRFMPNAIALTGDGVASCIISTEPKSNIFYEIEHIGIVPYLRADPYAMLPNKMLEMYKSIKSAAADCYEATSKQPKDFAWLLLSNYNYLTSRIFSQLLGFSLERAWLYNVHRTGHVPSSDPLINLYGLEQAGLIDSGSSVMLFINGPISCGTISLMQRGSG